MLRRIVSIALAATLATAAVAAGFPVKIEVDARGTHESKHTRAEQLALF